MITSGVNVLMIVNLDSGSGKAVLQKAQAQGIATIDYDRLTLGGGADFYVSFDNTKVGQLQGEGLQKCLDDAGKTTANIAMLNGSPTDNNATLFKAGAVAALQEKTTSGEYTVVADQAVPDWDNQQAGTIFEQMYTENAGKIDGVLAANDGLGNAAIAILKKNGVNGTVPVTGQDATDQGLQNILAGDQCMTVYKAVKKEADAAAALAIAAAKGEDTADLATGEVEDTESGGMVAAVLLDPQAIYFDNVKDVIADGYTTKDARLHGRLRGQVRRGRHLLTHDTAGGRPTTGGDQAGPVRASGRPRPGVRRTTPDLRRRRRPRAADEPAQTRDDAG